MTPHPATIGTDQEPEQDWRNYQWDMPLADVLPIEILGELSDIEDAMAAAGHHGPLRDTIPRLIADVEAQRTNLEEARRALRQQETQLATLKWERDEAVTRSKAAEKHALMLDDRARWVFDRALSFCVTELNAGDDA